MTVVSVVWQLEFTARFEVSVRHRVGSCTVVARAVSDVVASMRAGPSPTDTDHLLAPCLRVRARAIGSTGLLLLYVRRTNHVLRLHGVAAA